MIEHKKNTIGYWLSQLKEPWRSQALAVVSIPRPCDRPMREGYNGADGNPIPSTGELGARIFLSNGDSDLEKFHATECLRREDSGHKKIYMESCSDLLHALCQVYDLSGKESWWGIARDVLNGSASSYLD